MDADDSPPDMCMICMCLALLSSWAAGRLFLVLERPRSGFFWGESLPSAPLASPGLVGGEEQSSLAHVSWSRQGCSCCALLKGSSGVSVEWLREEDIGQVYGDSPGCGSPGNLICGPLWEERDGQEQLVLSQGLEIQANTSSRASLLAHRLEEQHPPSLGSWPPASVLH